MEINEKYRKIQEKFGLPHIQKLKETFNIEIKNDEKLFENIRNEISDRIFNLTEKILEPLIGQPESFCCFFEQDMLSNNERMKLFEIYKKIQVLKWENNLLLLHPNEKKTIEWIKKTWSFWNNELEFELTNLCKKLSIGWNNLKFSTERTYYHG
ncbi:MAG: hypothetical protein QXD48_02005 [Candidatus Aenigmatarchaeota archaeon]